MTYRAFLGAASRGAAVRRALLAAALLVAGAAAVACGPGEEEFRADTAGFLRAALHDADRDAGESAGRAARVRAALARFYEQRSYEPVWLERKDLTDEGEELVSLLGDAGDYGLDPQDYLGERLRGEIESWQAGRAAQADAPADQGESAPSDAEEASQASDRGDRTADAATRRARRGAALDAELTHAYLTFAADVGLGRVQPEQAGIAWHTTPRELDLAATLAQALAGDGLAASLERLEPPHQGYRQLARLHATYARLAAAGVWKPIPPGPALSAGDRGPRVAALRRRLAATGDLAGAGAVSPDQVDAGASAPGSDSAADAAADYDAELGEAVKRFQRRYGLEDDGAAGPHVLAELNVPAAQRLRQIEANLERWRWLPEELGSRYIMVNVPRYELAIVENGEVIDTMRVVVGEDYNATPVFSDEMSYVVFNPSWNLPSSIAREEVLPHLASDPFYLQSHNMQLVRGWSEDAAVIDPWSAPPDVVAGAGDDRSEVRLRQLPGPDNPLGRIKFMFPNDFNIYLHDTNARQLFERTDRNLSHGCIRIEHPIQLASYVLGKPESAIEAEIARGETRTESLPRKIPVHIFYWTAFVDEHGGVNFRDDLYDVDQRVLAALDRARPPAFELTVPAEPLAAPTPEEGAAEKGAKGEDDNQAGGEEGDAPPSKPKG